MFKPFARIALCCNTVMRMKTPGQFTNCDCGQFAIDAGDGYMMRTIGPAEFFGCFENKTQEMIELYRPEFEAVSNIIAAEGLEGLDLHGKKDLYEYLASLTGKERQEAKRLYWGFLYSPETT